MSCLSLYVCVKVEHKHNVGMYLCVGVLNTYCSYLTRARAAGYVRPNSPLEFQQRAVQSLMLRIRETG